MRETISFRPELIHWDGKKGCVLVETLPPQTARELSKHLGGCFYPGRGYATWQNGGRSVTIVSRESWEAVEGAREVAQDLTGRLAGFTIGQISRGLVDWIGENNPDSTEAARRNLEQCWRFYMCKPCRLESASLYDLESCFYTLLAKTPSVNPVFTSKDLIWLNARSSGDELRFRTLISRVADLKQLRNALVGAMVGGASGKFYYKGESRDYTAVRGSRVELGAAIVRTAFELCQLEAQASGAVYANVDSIIISGDSEPKIWSAANLPYRLLARGQGDIVALGNYEVGSPDETKLYKRTAYYKKGSGNYPELAPPRTVKPVYHPWVYAA